MVPLLIVPPTNMRTTTSNSKTVAIALQTVSLPCHHSILNIHHHHINSSTSSSSSMHGSLLFPKATTILSLQLLPMYSAWVLLLRVPLCPGLLLPVLPCPQIAVSTQLLSPRAILEALANHHINPATSIPSNSNKNSSPVRRTSEQALPHPSRLPP